MGRVHPADRGNTRKLIAADVAIATIEANRRGQRFIGSVGPGGVIINPEEFTTPEGEKFKAGAHESRFARRLARGLTGFAGDTGSGGAADEARKTREADLKAARDAFERAQIADAGPFTKILLERNKAIREHGSSPEAKALFNQAAVQQTQNEIRKMQEAAHKQLREDEQQREDSFRAQEIARFQEQQRLREEITDDSFRRASERQLRSLDLASERIDQQRELELLGLESVTAQSLQQKIALEDAKLAIENDYAQRSLGVQLQKLAFERAAALRDLGERFDQQNVSRESAAFRIAAGEIDQKYGQDADALREAAAAREVHRTRQTAIEKAKIQIDENRRIFDSMKDQANGLLDQIFSKTRNVGDMIKGVLKAAFLTPIKDAASSQIAAFMTRLVTGQKVDLETAAVTGTGPLAGLRRIMARLGVGAQPRFRGIDSVQPVNNSVPVWIMNSGQQAQQQAQQTANAVKSGVSGGLIGGIAAGAGVAALGGLLRGGKAEIATSKITAYGANAIAGHYGLGPDGKLAWLGGLSKGPFGGIPGAGPGGTPPFLPPGTSSAGTAAQAGRFGALKASALGLGSSAKGILTNLGNLGTSPGMRDVAAEWGLNLKGVQGVAGGLMLAGGAGLVMSGLQRGGFSGALQTAAGGALIGAKFGGPIGGLIGGAIGLGVGLIRGFRKSAEEKAREKIQKAYGLTVKDKGVLKQIVEIARANYGGNLDMAIRSQQVRELLELYAMSTGQPFGTQAKVRPVSLAQTAGGLVQNEIYENGRALAFAGITTRNPASLIPGNTGGLGQPTNYGGGQVNVTLTLDPKQTLEVFDGRTVRTVAANPRAVQTASNNASRQNFGRRESTALQLEPGTLFA